MKDPFNAFFYKACKEQIKSSNKKKRKGGKKTTIIPGVHQTQQKISSQPGSADAPSSSTYKSQG